MRAAGASTRRAGVTRLGLLHRTPPRCAGIRSLPNPPQINRRRAGDSARSSRAEFGGDVLENWQSEFLQFFLYILATIWLLERGSSESKSEDDVGLMSDQSQFVRGYAKDDSPGWARVDGLRRRLYKNSLGLAMLLYFLGSWLGQSVTDWRAFNHEQLDRHRTMRPGSRTSSHAALALVRASAKRWCTEA